MSTKDVDLYLLFMRIGRAPRTARGDCYSRRETGDSYVIVKLGNELAKTKVINICLNPVSDEKLSLTPKDPEAVLALEVFDKDDKMDHATLSLPNDLCSKADDKM
ncbi:hypothetical protein HID58_055671 [Brassica napus]|uniref:C2 domain-containing protein n=1 Tax=Brassica napus TaxID=3708 RepID=A0ABQ8ALW8_BRANA|nr:hypothetical protein HID58_055671 [Brassica napus]